ncbi:MAG: kelch repeat-containing protein [Opitutaceae bacterium]
MTNIDFSAWKELVPLPLPRAGCAVGIIGGELVVAGGTYWQDGRKYWSERVDAFDPATNCWTARTPLPRPRGDAAAAICDSTLYVFGGGADGVAESTVWALRDNRWSELPHLALPVPRRSASVAVVDGTFHLLGGLPGTGSDFSGATSTVWAAKPGGHWETRAPIPGPARFNLSVGVVAGRIIVAGGCTPEDGGVRNLDEILAYHPPTDAWTQLGRLPLAIRAAGGLADDSGLLLFGGYTDRFEAGILRYDVPSGRVESVGRLPVGLAGAHFLRAGRTIIGVTGENGVKMRFPGTLSSN